MNEPLQPTHPVTIQHEGRTYRLVPDEAEVARAKRDAEVDAVLKDADMRTRMDSQYLSRLDQREVAVTMTQTQVRLLAAILREVRQ